jgi:polyribonucleotide nucleotidyltransferase
MDAGVPITRPVAGVAMGMIQGDGKSVILTDILGEEDHCGDMDLKVAGTQKGITAIQMDVKISGIEEEELVRALDQAREARLDILRTMLQALEAPRPEISQYAPRLIQMKINPEKIGAVIGPGGKVVRLIQEETDCRVDIEDDGTITISSLSAEGAETARRRIEELTQEAEVGRIYEGTVSTIKDFGAFVQILPGVDGLVHVSELSDSYVRDISTICKVGDSMLVKVIDIDGQGRIRLSRKAALKEKQ